MYEKISNAALADLRCSSWSEVAAQTETDSPKLILKIKTIMAKIAKDSITGSGTPYKQFCTMLGRKFDVSA